MSKLTKKLPVLWNLHTIGFWLFIIAMSAMFKLDGEIRVAVVSATVGALTAWGTHIINYYTAEAKNGKEDTSATST